MFRHVGIVVEDMDRMSSFYQNTFNLEVMYDEVEELEHIAGFDKVKGHIQKLGTNGITIIELLKWDVTDKESISSDIFDYGISHFALTVDDVEETCKKSHLIIYEPKKSPDGKVKLAFCHDPEGNVLELVELL
jgi:catechol 2,3-dioxygenase-like lactoylglutathione lyase family enzyme